MEEYLLFRSLKGQTTAAEDRRVRAWREQSPESERSYQELAVVLEAARATETRIDTEPPSVFKLIHAAKTRAESEVGEPLRRIRFVIIAVAATLGLAVGIAQWPWAPLRQVHAKEIVTAAAESATVTLEDGSVVRLGPHSQLRIFSGTDSRAIAFEGEAFFAVAHDRGRPFRVETAAGEVEVMGTRFHLETEPDDLRVTVVEGRVRLAGKSGNKEVRAGEMGRVIRGTLLPPVPVSDFTGLTARMGKFLAFQDTPLVDAAREIETLYHVRIDITDERIKQQTITTWFVDEPVAHVLEIFCLVAEAECTTAGYHTTLAPKHR